MLSSVVSLNNTLNSYLKADTIFIFRQQGFLGAQAMQIKIVLISLWPIMKQQANLQDTEVRKAQARANRYI